MYIVLNHKSNFTYDEIITYRKNLSKIKTTTTLIVCPSSCYLPLFSNMTLGAQDVSSKGFGAYTGDISAAALKSLSVEYVLINHSEHHCYHHDTVLDIKGKLKQVKANDLIPIICIGETKEENTAKNYVKYLKDQLQQLLEGLDLEKYMIAYEPVFSIGTNELLDSKELAAVIKHLQEHFQVPILYGGGISEKTIAKIKTIPYLSGVLLGTSSLDLSKTVKIIQTLEQVPIE